MCTGMLPSQTTGGHDLTSGTQVWLQASPSSLAGIALLCAGIVPAHNRAIESVVAGITLFPCRPRPVMCGYHPLDLQALCRGVGISLNSILLYFANKGKCSDHAEVYPWERSLND